jgi:hypothetical protein
MKFLRLSAILVLFCSSPAIASTPEYFNKVVDAIYLAEGGSKAKVPYGILSVKVSSKEEARKVCYNTVRNNWKRWENSGNPGTYLEFLASRYAPVGAKNDPTGLNRNWIKNVSYFLGRAK